MTTELGEEPVTLELYLETGFPLVEELSKEFTEQYPQVSFDIRSDQFAALTENAPRVMASNDAPDLIRLPTIVDSARDGLLLNLDPYVDAYGWDEFPESQLEQMRVGEDGTRGSGSLYALGVGYSVTGVYYNKEIAARIGMDEPPATIDELEQAMADAKAAGEQPIMQFNDIGGVAFPYQALLNQMGDPGAIADWIFQKPGASIDTEAAVEAATHVGRWAEQGYFPADANSLDYTTMMGRFTEGTGLFMFNGDWESANLDESMGADVGFFLMPPVEEGNAPVAMGAPNTYAVPAKSDHRDEVAFFLDWIHTNEEARDILVNQGGAAPGGPASLPLPEVPDDSLVSQTLQGAQTIGESGVLVDFMANATSGIYAGSIRPELQRLLDGRTEPEAVPAALQQAYEEELDS
ncbi:ABC-type glycerol-3-phosphate transport system substrate-binding protein [Nocardioides salarius]|uniref:ABC-type glycerol-3-phosphate transport system substrate-binding protein n=1 Tax=Nocardioides salarius TaxID=374513 RepID=A0ABS2M9V6_9ACTN|nr:extracellular solute-binding protein [Nocardioides salarius]MBM7507970.1 ABC-type glycerol-3-phosphate transport system substrate-binding protein [Nocardioides salarius]